LAPIDERRLIPLVFLRTPSIDVADERAAWRASTDVSSDMLKEDPLSWPPERHLTREEASAYARALGFRMQASSLAKFACRGDGPLITYLGAKPYYVLADLRSWLESRTRRSRSTQRPPRPDKNRDTDEE
jgi:hypothetical protein